MTSESTSGGENTTKEETKPTQKPQSGGCCGSQSTAKPQKPSGGGCCG